MSRLTSWHIGATGDRPGGIAQVILSYTSHKSTRRLAKPMITTRGWRRDPASLFLFVLALARVAGLRVRRRTSTDVLVVHLSHGGSFVREGMIGAWGKLLGFGVMVQIHGSNFPAFAARHATLVRVALSRFDKVLVLTGEAESTVSRLCPRTPVLRYRNCPPLASTGADIAAASSKEKVVLFGGEVGTRKGADTLLEAWSLLDEKAKRGWKLVVAGPVGAGGETLLGSYSELEDVSFLGPSVYLVCATCNSGLE
jgi:hypothetical protein